MGHARGLPGGVYLFGCPLASREGVNLVVHYTARILSESRLPPECLPEVTLYYQGHLVQLNRTFGSAGGLQ